MFKKNQNECKQIYDEQNTKILNKDRIRHPTCMTSLSSPVSQPQSTVYTYLASASGCCP